MEEVKTIKGIVKVIKEITPWQTKTGKTMQTCGVLLETSEGDQWINIREFSTEAAQKKLMGVVEGDKYIVYLDAKYGNVKSFVDLKDDPYDSLSDKQLESTQREVNEATGVSTPAPEASKGGNGGIPHTSFNQGARIGMLFNNAVNICIAEKKTRIQDIESQFNTLRTLLNQLEDQ